MSDVYVLNPDALRTAGLNIDGSRRAVRRIRIGDCACMTSWVGHKGSSSRIPCLWCTALRRRRQGNGLLLDTRPCYGYTAIK